MSKAQVKALNLGGTVQETEDKMLLTDATLLGGTADIDLLFYNDNLILMDMIPAQGFTNQEYGLAEAYFEKLYQEIRVQAGHADQVDRDWTKDADGSEAWKAYWSRQDFELEIMVEMSSDGTMSNLRVVISDQLKDRISNRGTLFE